MITIIMSTIRYWGGHFLAMLLTKASEVELMSGGVGNWRNGVLLV